HCVILYLLSGMVLLQLYYTTKAATGLSFSDNPVVFRFCGAYCDSPFLRTADGKSKNNHSY
ncbi:MAG: hypothetical protein IKU40_04150, partial [Clostridia bacterium]|nr:hypothetical protein [Clostridia bacterium]